MADQIIRNSSGATIAKIATDSNGVLTIRDPNGAKKGTYDPRTNKTRNKNGASVGTGNLLMTLL